MTAAYLIAYDLTDEGQVRSRRVVTLDENRRPCVLDSGSIVTIFPAWVAWDDDPQPYERELALMTEIGQLELSHEHWANASAVGNLLGLRQLPGEHLPALAQRVADALNAHPVMNILSREAEVLSREIDSDPSHAIILREVISKE